MAETNTGKVNFELVTPTELMISEDTDMVVVPGAEGDFGVLPGHTPFLTTLRAGLINIHQGGVVAQSLFVEGGFAEATPERCTVLATVVRPMDEVSPEYAKARLNDAEEALRGADEGTHDGLEVERAAAEAMVKAAEMRAAS
ncbi:MAG: ATP synthase F1 subunit epsilon [Pseudomonadota bacterium]|nr:ATP synthase F1 subunit epsilon [Pseudomonadota bacterium]